MESREVVAASDAAAEAPGWELHMLLQRAAELERLLRFEEALVLYHRGRQRAPLVRAFQEGVERAEKAVNSAIGSAATDLFSDLPGLLPGMIEEQRSARTQARRAARTAHERRSAAVRSMTFSDAPGGEARGDSTDDEVEGGGRQVAVRRQQRRRSPQH